MLNNYGLKYAKYFSKEDAVKKFNWPSVIGGVSYFLLEQGYNSGNVTFVNDSTGKEIKTSLFREIGYIPLDCDNIELTRSISQKTKSLINMDSIFMRGQTGSKAVEKMAIGANVCYRSRGRTAFIDASKEKDINKYKVAFKYANGARVCDGSMILLPGETCTESFQYFCVNNLNQANNLLSYVSSSIVVFLRSLIMNSHNNTSKTWTTIPVMDITKPWTNADVYQHFGLSPEEITYVESVVK